jgi:hypothetical protein
MTVGRIAGILRDRDVMVLSDEIYSQIVYAGEPPVSIARYPGMVGKTIILDATINRLCGSTPVKRDAARLGAGHEVADLQLELVVPFRSRDSRSRKRRRRSSACLLRPHFPE